MQEQKPEVLSLPASISTEPEILEPEVRPAPYEIPPRKPNKKRPGVSYPNRLLQALASVYEDPDSTLQERISAVRMSIETMKIRGKPKRKTDRDKAVLKALETNNSLDKPKKEVILDRPESEESSSSS